MTRDCSWAGAEPFLARGGLMHHHAPLGGQGGLKKMACPAEAIHDFVSRTGYVLPPGQCQCQSQSQSPSGPSPESRSPRASRGRAGCFTGVGGLRPAAAARPSQLLTKSSSLLVAFGIISRDVSMAILHLSPSRPPVPLSACACQFAGTWAEAGMAHPGQKRGCSRTSLRVPHAKAGSPRLVGWMKLFDGHSPDPRPMGHA
jgi:hypothetical protein